MPKKGEITPKQELFVEEYLIDLNATQAAIRAGYSPDTAAETGYKLCHKSSVKTAIARAKAKRSKRTGISADRVLQELARIAFCDPSAVIDFATAEVKDSASEDDLRVVSGVKVKYVPHKSYDECGDMIVDEAIEREVKLCDKLKALDMLCKHLGLYDKNSEEEAEGTGVVQIPAVMDNPGPPSTSGGVAGG